MIDFILSKSNERPKSYSFHHELPLGYHLYCSKQVHFLEYGNTKLLIIGDCINFRDLESKAFDIDTIINGLKGNFYAFLYNESTLHVTSSAFGLLPVFYLDDYSGISSSVDLLHDFTNLSLTQNKKWIINQLLFNYQFSDDSYFEEVRLFPSMSYLFIDNVKCKFIRYYSVEDELLDKPLSWKKALPDLSKKFIETTKLYLPETNSLISFTGGFDGRTLVSVASHFKYKFSTVSYGKIGNDDVYLPKANSKDLNISYKLIELEKKYSLNNYYDSADAYIKKSNGQNGFLYAHVDYFANNVKDRGDVLLSGICGSELFRAAHASGAVTSKALLDLFRTDDFEAYKKLIYSSETLIYLDKDDFKKALYEVAVSSWDYKQSLLKRLDKNKALYVFVYEEIFRKFFGPWVKVQMDKIVVRTPYLDFDFFKHLIKTELSGAYSEFLTNNPLKRYKGQLLYAEVIRRTNRKLYWMKTGKGYPPAYVNSSLLRPLLLVPFLKKRIGRKVIKTDFDNLGLISGIKCCVHEIEKLFPSSLIDERLLCDLDDLKNTDKETFRDTILMSCSILKITEKFENGK